MFVWLQGCAVIPVMEDEPFKGKTVTELEPGEVNRADVLMALGEPAIVHDDEKVFLYTDDQVHAVWFIVAGGPGGAGVIGGVIGTRHFLVFEFDERGQVARRAAIPYDTQHQMGASGVTSRTILGPRNRIEGSACVPSGLCIADYFGTQVFANTKRDAAAKTVKPSSRCTVYAYRDDSGENTYMGKLYAYHLKFDRQFAGMLHSNGYRRFEVAPGHHEVAVNGRFIVSGRPDTMPPAFGRVRFHCKAGDVHYVRLHIQTNSNWMGYLKFKVEAETIDAERGRTAILKRRLLLNPVVPGGKKI